MCSDIARYADGLPIPNLGSSKDTDRRVYNVVAKTHEDLNNIYEDMENRGGPQHVPDRIVECINRREDERATSYSLSYDEAVALYNDPRVLAVELSEEELNWTRVNHWTTTDSFDYYKNGVQYQKVPTSSWSLLGIRSKGNDSFAGYPWNNYDNTTVSTDSSGKNVDIVIAELAIPYPDATEYASNSDGTGYSRYAHYNWANYFTTGGSQIHTISPGNYLYDYSTWHEHGHAASTASVAAGLIGGFAKDANLYGIRPLDFPSTPVEVMVKNWHNNKPINPKTGIKNPSIVNQSWGFSSGVNTYNIVYIWYRGVQYSPDSGDGTQGTARWSNLNTRFKINFTSEGNFGFGNINTTFMANTIDAVAAGVIFVGSGGNTWEYWATPSSNPAADWNNYIYDRFGNVLYYHRGGIPNMAYNELYSKDDPRYIESSPVAVGSVAAWLEYPTGGLRQKSGGSAFGPGITIFAPSDRAYAVQRRSNNPVFDDAYTDPKYVANVLNNGYREDTENNHVVWFGGTSCSAPITAGVIACMLEKNPRWKQKDVRQWLKYDQPNNMYSSTQGYVYQTHDIAANPLSPIYDANATKSSIYLPSTRNKDMIMMVSDINGIFSENPYTGYNHTSSRSLHSSANTGFAYPRKNKLMNTYNSSVSADIFTDSLTYVNGNTVTLTVNTTGIPNGTKLRYIITARYQAIESSAQILSNVQILNTTGKFSCNAVKINPYERIVISGTLSTGTGQGSIFGYSAPGPITWYAAYKNAQAANTSTTTFWISSTYDAAHLGNDTYTGTEWISTPTSTLTTTAGTTNGLTFKIPYRYNFNPFSINNVPLVGDITINSNTGSLSIPLTTTDKIWVQVRIADQITSAGINWCEFKVN